jgi:hypothetical protein
VYNKQGLEDAIKHKKLLQYFVTFLGLVIKLDGCLVLAI